jgi:multimeric flavodoxin WrbA
MYVTAINGSPHPEGNSRTALNHAADRLSESGVEVEMINLCDRDIGHCRGCFACRSGECVQDDDMGGIIESLLKCDCILLASPVYMGSVTGLMKTFMDRTVILRVRKGFELSGRIGAGISCGGFRNGGQELTLQTMHTFFLQQDMYAMSDGPRFSHSGAAIVGKTEDDEVGLRTVDCMVDRIITGIRRDA